ncbi:MAG: GNAT family N-acetyltransferase, partial [Candidatus Thiodiazotropha taylori]|nr:GNAT family N-acetyltransferase [Candidatus Thiodiazotropha taylori]MCW4254051.1 GNAT family N-acetyltransferase [Candidatus Thiodiazotropha taylori]
MINDPNTLWIGEHPPEGIAHADNRQALQHLGRESGLLIYNAFSGFDPDAFGAVSGTLTGGGLLLLLTPSLDHWAEYADPEAERITVANYELPRPSHFFTRLAKLLDTEPSSARITVEGIKAAQTANATNQLVPVSTDPSCLTEDQSTAVEAIIHVVKGHGRRPLVLSSDRGRGKSSALGIAAARLIEAGYQRILVTASRQAAVESLFSMAASELGLEAHGVELHHQQGVIEYVAPDRLVQEKPRGDLLLVDEAAAIPTPVLIKLLEHYPRIAFATTVHGYEGTGLGFNHRFKKHLDQQRPQWREIQLKTPIRWAMDDPLEQLVFRMLALDAEPTQIDPKQSLASGQLSVTFPDQKQLMEDEQQLQQFFGLLVLAHYRTTPRDLWHLLDGPNLQPVVVTHDQQIVAVALLATEGEFSTELAEQIWLGRRRPRGHLLAQSLSAHLGLRAASTLKGLRIMRIAVHPA